MVYNVILTNYANKNVNKSKYKITFIIAFSYFCLNYSFKHEKSGF